MKCAILSEAQCLLSVEADKSFKYDFFFHKGLIYPLR